jgi:hypothetical protein
VNLTGVRIQVSGFRFQVSGLEFQVSVEIALTTLKIALFAPVPSANAALRLSCSQVFSEASANCDAGLEAVISQALPP